MNGHFQQLFVCLPEGTCFDSSIWTLDAKPFELIKAKRRQREGYADCKGRLSHRIHGAGIYANIWGILMGSMLPYVAAPVAYMDPMGMRRTLLLRHKMRLIWTFDHQHSQLTARHIANGHHQQWSSSVAKVNYCLVNGHFRIRLIGGTDSIYIYIYLAYFSGLCKGISAENMAQDMIQYLHFRILSYSH